MSDIDALDGVMTLAQLSALFSDPTRTQAFCRGVEALTLCMQELATAGLMPDDVIRHLLESEHLR